MVIAVKLVEGVEKALQGLFLVDQEVNIVK
ncbi:hypothetical protein ES703_85456 [subsurface metagenome]